MAYERNPRGGNPQGDYYNRGETQDYGRDYGSGRSYSYSSARDYESAGRFDRDRDDDRGGYARDAYGSRDRGGYGRDSYGQSDYGRDDRDGGRGYGRREETGDRYGAYGRGGDDRYGQYGRQGSYGASNQSNYARGDEYHGSYASDGRRFEDVGARRHWDDDNARQRGDRDQHRDRGQSYGRQPQGYDYDDRGFLARAGDEVRSWFGDEDAERRREMDSRYDDRYYNQQGGSHSDGDYHSWRSGQIAALDRDYHEYRQENRSKFENEFSSWRSNRQTQRDSLNKVQEHAEVLGSDGSHVGTVDKVRGDRILLTKNDPDAGGQHHSIPSSWIKSVEDKKVTLSKTADEAKQHWRNEENSQAMFGYGDRTGNDRDRSTGASTGTSASGATSGNDTGSATGGTNLNRSFSGTY
ncbi:DUF2171 domain-containing protein [Sphingomonas sp.]|uniref:DUF2171 domain-containing protein n=1 Tax=Sphingomonas sp. TaxID=28214 RepID=UPI0035C80FF3